MDARGFFSIVLIILSFAVSLSSSEALAQTPRASSTTLQLDSESEEESRPFLLKLFEKYGDNGQMTFEGFEHLLQSIGLGNVQIGDHDVHDHRSEDGFREFHSDHDHNDSMSGRSAAEEGRMEAKLVEEAATSDEGRRVKSAERKRKKARGGRRNVTERPGHPDGQIEGRQKRSSVLFVEQKCATPAEILRSYRIQYADGISEPEFVTLCPAIVYQLDQHVCHAQQHAPCHHHEGRDSHCAKHHHPSNHSHSGDEESSASATSWKTWCFATLSVLVISLVGLGGVAVIPIMDKLFYNQLLQFLIALAVGTLTGDALLHLLPHAMVPHHHSSSEADSHCSDTPDAEDAADGGHGNEENAVWIGLISLFGIFLFFVMERILNLCSDRKRHRKLRKSETKEEELSTVGRKLADHTQHAHCPPKNDYVLVVQQCTDLQIDDDDDCAKGGLLELHPIRPQLPGATDHVVEECHSQTDENANEQAHEHVDGHEHRHSHGHSHEHSHEHIHEHIHVHGHSHGHSHEVPKSVSSAAWMVIMGDGLHNFTDGLAIGASFANSMAVGLSTTVAVFCHELPHELGDFAVLLKAGMTIRQALVYNMVSSALCFAGMAIGVAIGNMESAISWIFAATAGIFLYIALVDMLPQITSSDSTSSSSYNGFSILLSFVLHVTGIASGITSMLLIALYEDRIQLSIGDT